MVSKKVQLAVFAPNHTGIIYGMYIVRDPYRFEVSKVLIFRRGARRRQERIQTK